MKVVIYSVSVLMLAVLSYLVFKSWRIYQDAKAKQVKIDWAIEQLRRALDQTRMQRDSDIIAGIQCLSTLSLPEIRGTVLSRLTELTESDNETIAKHAEWAIARLSKSMRSRVAGEIT